MLTQTKKNGTEEKLLSKAGVNDDEVVVAHHDLNDKRNRFRKIAPLKLNFEHMGINHAPYVMLGNTNEEIKRRTGFKSENELLACALMLRNLDLDLLSTSQRKLTWHEEWFLCFEFGWDRTVQRWIDVSSLSTHGTSDDSVGKVFDAKMTMNWNCRESWPEFASCDEDLMFRDIRWNRKFEDKRVIM